MTFPSEAEHAAAVKAALTAANAKPYDYGVTIPSTETAYNLITVSDRFGGVLRSTAQSGTRGVRVTVRSVGKGIDPTDPLKNAREMRRRVDLALREKRLTVAGFVTTPIQLETAETIDLDGDVLTSGSWFSGLVAFTYAI